MSGESSCFLKLALAPLGGGFSRAGHWVWCGSPIRGEDGRVHLFASSWPKTVAFNPNWMTNSRVVRAVSERPEGPFCYVEDVLPPRGPEFWDGRATHNATIHKHGGVYHLYYTGMTFPEPIPDAENPLAIGSALQLKARASQRIGVATAPSVKGPWTRRDAPLLEPRPGKWDALMTTNPAVCIHPDGRTLLAYKSVDRKNRMHYGIAAAPSPIGPFERLSDEPIFRFEGGAHAEDAYLWHNGDGYELIMKDMTGAICGEKHAGVHATSRDGVEWTLSDPARAYSRTVRWSDGSQTVQGNLERPQLLFEGDRPTHICFATTSDGKHFSESAHTYNLCIPLE